MVINMYLSAAANAKSFIYSPTITRKKPIEYSLDRTPALSAEKTAERTVDEDSFYLHMEEIKTLRAERDRIIFAKEEVEELLAERNEIASGAVTVYTPEKAAKPPLRIPSFENRVDADLIYNGEEDDDLLEKLIEAWTTTEDDEKVKIKNRRPRGADDAFMNMLLMRNEMMQGIKKARNTVLKIEQDQFDDIFKHMEDNTNPETTEIKIETETTTAAQTETEAENEENIEEQAS